MSEVWRGLGYMVLMASPGLLILGVTIWFCIMDDTHNRPKPQVPVSNPPKVEK